MLLTPIASGAALKTMSAANTKPQKKVARVRAFFSASLFWLLFWAQKSNEIENYE
jgi:hypothetical protein